MFALRALIQRYRLLAFAAIAAALAFKAILPVGTMLSATGPAITVTLCSDATGLPQTLTIALGKKSSNAAPDHDQHQGTCPYSQLAMAGAAGADTALLALALVFLLALGFAPVRSVVLERLAYLSPPLRGPPSLT